jgi:hypothetical protein
MNIVNEAPGILLLDKYLDWNQACPEKEMQVYDKVTNILKYFVNSPLPGFQR